jgi:hypothetical protein
MFVVEFAVAVQHWDRFNCKGLTLSPPERTQCLAGPWLNQHQAGLAAIPGWVVLVAWLGVDLALGCIFLGLANVDDRRSEPWWKQR